MTPPPSVHGGSSSEEPAETGRSGGASALELGLVNARHGDGGEDGLERGGDGRDDDAEDAEHLREPAMQR